MRKLTFIFAALLASSPAPAGSLTIETTDATDGTVTNTFSTFTDAHITRWIAANQTACNIQGNGVCSRTQVLNYIATKFVADQVEAVRKYEEEVAASTAVTAVTPIIVEP